MEAAASRARPRRPAPRAPSLATEAEIKEALGDFDESLQSDDDASIASIALAPKLKRRADAAGLSPDLPPTRAQLAALMEEALNIPEFAAAVAAPDAAVAEPDNGTPIVRTPQLAARDVASVAIALGMRGDSTVNAWKALIESAGGDVAVPATFPPEFYVTCARTAIRAAAIANAKNSVPVAAHTAKARFALNKEDLVKFGIEKIGTTTTYDLYDLQRGAHRKWGDAKSIERHYAECRRRRELVEKRKANRAEEIARSALTAQRFLCAASTELL
jgi:hypothetical protein